ncbi:hypothetical protein H5410_041989 [Solanum commersonii]|uniref:Uncharacterized protein n=1 Tax=Solanum commersonii TaxID=4109 RepID=A0A9J5XT33_SOLCO|nr:hypothetical protein H5410_041989 [Solanum commersonii]
METIFTENDCSNVQPTPEENRSLNLSNNSHVPSTQPSTSNVNHEEVPGFEGFSSKPLGQLLMRSTQRRKVTLPTKTNVPKATQPDEQPNHSFQTSNSQSPQVDNVSGVPHNTVSKEKFRTMQDLRN